MNTTTDLEARVIAIVADALNHPVAEVKRSSSLMDDLGAESIDFIDIVFRLESELDIVIPNEELWAGSLDGTVRDQASIDAAVAKLRQTMPEFRWDRFPNGVTKNDLPRLITVNTIVEYLHKHT